MRYKFAREGVRVASGRYFEPLSLTWDHEPIMVTWMFGHNVKDILGKATNLEREEDGWLTAEIEWKKDTIWETVDGVNTGVTVETPSPAETLLESGEVELSIYCTDVTFKSSSLWVTGARIRSISVIIFANLWKEQ